MIDFSITEEDIAKSKQEWEPKFALFAKRTTKILLGTRRLPIFDHATGLAEEWLQENVIGKFTVPANRAFLLIGDEHLHAAARRVLNGNELEYTFIYREAWYRWHDTEFRGNPWWFVSVSWEINSPIRLIEIVEHFGSQLELHPNEAYLLSIAAESRGTDSICRLIDGKLVVDEPYNEWVSS